MQPTVVLLTAVGLHLRGGSGGAGRTLSSVQGHLALDSVGFAYPQRLEAPVFANFSLQIPPGTSLALVGTSGSGKCAAHLQKCQ